MESSGGRGGRAYIAGGQAQSPRAVWGRGESSLFNSGLVLLEKAVRLRAALPQQYPPSAWVRWDGPLEPVSAEV